MRDFNGREGSSVTYSSKDGTFSYKTYENYTIQIKSQVLNAFYRKALESLLLVIKSL